MPLILPGNVGSATAATGFNVANSVRMNAADSAKMTIDFSGAGNQKKFTISCWVKRATVSPGASQTILSNYADVNNFCNFTLSTGDTLDFVNRDGGTFNANIGTSRLFRDVSAWYHVVLSVDTTQGTDTNRIKIYVNGVHETSLSSSTYPDQNTDLKFNTTATTNFGSWSGSAQYADGYYSELVFIDNAQLAADSFGEFDDDSGIWKPIDVSGLTFGTNGFYLDFEDSSNLGNDANGGTDLTEVNLAATDQSTDTCTNNFATLNPLRTQAGYTKVMSEGNCVWEHGQAGQNASIPSTIAASSGKWYAEFLCSTSANNWGFGIAQVNVTNGGSMAGYPDSQGGVTYLKDGRLAWYNGGDQSSDTGTTYAADDIIGILMDLDNTRAYWYKNDTLVNSGGFDYSVVNSGSTLENNYYFMAGATDDGTNPIIKANFGGSPGFAISSGNTDGNGYGNFEFATKGGYALNTKKPIGVWIMAYTDIDNPTEIFTANLYSGNATNGKTITTGHTNDLIWTKGKSGTYGGRGLRIIDSVRGATKVLYGDQDLAQGTNNSSSGVTGFASTSYTIGGDADFNGASTTYVSWTWKIQAGVCDIQTYDGASNTRTISHNLGVVPKAMIFKRFDEGAWIVYHADAGGADKYLVLNTTAAVDTATTLFNNTVPTSSVFSVGNTNSTNGNGISYIVYLFGNKQGVSKVGSYTGNGASSANSGAFVYTGFKPALVIVKNLDTEGWQIWDNKRSSYNGEGSNLSANSANAESTGVRVHFFSNGYQLVSSGADQNSSGATFSYISFAESPFVSSSGVPATAR